LYDLTGKVALVTGAGGETGIGRGIALRLAEEGADVIVNDLIMQPAIANGWGGITDVVQEIEAMGRQGLAVASDVSDAAQVENMVNEGLERFGHIDILVNNAAAPAGRDRVPVVELEEEAWDLVQRVNVKGTFLCSRAVARVLIERGAGGKIINISSTAGKRGVAQYAAYCASKFAVIGFTQALAQELGPHGITVNAICPGGTLTSRFRELGETHAPENVDKGAFSQEWLAQVAAGIPLGRLGQVSDIANMAAFLASSQSDWITGASISVAGGHVMD
jgi:NAD(P)-dependent dehydrogenase (short-subunit alcohol dehydrogenase family)